MANGKFNKVEWTLNSMQSIPRFGTSAEAAEWTKMSKERLEELANGGVAPCVRIDGGEPLFFRSDIVEWVKTNLIKIQDGKEIPIHLHVQIPEYVDSEKVPNEIAHLNGLSESRCVFPSACIYFLSLENKVVYVGQSVNLMLRLFQHKHTKSFDRVFYLPVPESQLNRIEAEFIRLLKPPLNKVFPSVGELQIASINQ